MERCAILLADAVARKRTTLFLGLVQGKATRTKVEKGELVVSDSYVSDYKRALYYLENDQAVMLCTEEGIEVAFLADCEVLLLKAIASPLTRYEVYSSGKCTWGQGLHLHDAVSVFIPLLSVLASAVIRYIGKIDGYPGTMFGVEITVSNVLSLCTQHCHGATDYQRHGLQGSVVGGFNLSNSSHP